MQTVRRAVIDIGTNSVKVLVADVSGKAVQPVFEDSKQTRLGHGFYESHLLQPEPVAQTAAAVALFGLSAMEAGAQSIRVIATSAARDAKNPGVLLDAIERASNLKVEIISGEQEADWAYQGATSDSSLANNPLLLLDVGGGSTEFILGHGEQKDFRHSFPLGAVRMLEKFPVSDPPAPGQYDRLRDWLRQFLQTEVRPKIQAELYYEGKFSSVQLIGTGGTTSILARMELQAQDFDRARIEAVRLTRPQVAAWQERLWSVSLAQRQQIVGLPKKRADVILTGTAIYQAVMEEFGFAELRVSTRGLRFAAVMG